MKRAVHAASQSLVRDDDWRIKKYGAALDVDDATSIRLSKIRQGNTTPEQTVRRILRAIGQTYRLCNRDLPGSPDIANRAKRWAVFVHGCFWHHHERCTKATIPKRNRDFWIAKLEANRTRDARAIAQLVELGFRVAVVWECELGDPDNVVHKLERTLAPASSRVGRRAK